MNIKILRTAAIVTALSALAVGGGMYAVYRHFVTPDVIVELAAVNAVSDFKNSLTFLNKDESKIFRTIDELGGRAEIKMTLKGSGESSNVDFTVTSDFDDDSSVSRIDFYNKLTFDVYKDDKQVIVSTPLFSDDITVSLQDIEEKFENSIFKDLLDVNTEFDTTKLLTGLVCERYNAKDFIMKNAPRLNIVKDGLHIVKDGRVKVMKGGKFKKADLYSAEVSSEISDELLDMLTDYIVKADNSTSEQYKASVRNYFANTVCKSRVEVAIIGHELREINVITDDGNKKTIGFWGASNPYNEIVVYENGDTRNALRRSRVEHYGKVKDFIVSGGNTLLSLENERNGIKLKGMIYGLDIQLKAYNKSTSKTNINFGNVEIDIKDVAELDGSINLSTSYNEDFSFNKSSSSIDLFGISAEDWDIISSVTKKAINMLATGEL